MKPALAFRMLLTAVDRYATNGIAIQFNPVIECVNMAKPKWAADWTIGLRVGIERGEQAILGHVQAQLMDAIDREHSITAAAKTARMSYRRAWTLIQEMNRAAGAALIEAAVEASKGAGQNSPKKAGSHWKFIGDFTKT